MTVRAAAIVPAAGRSERFGSMKLLAPIGGEPLLNHTLRSLLNAGVDRVVVVLAPRADLDEATLLRDTRVTTVLNPDPSQGMFSSIQAGLAAVDAATVLVLPADMPFVRSATVAAILTRAEESDEVVRPSLGEQHGHPIALPGRIREQLMRMDTRRSLKQALADASVDVREIEVDDTGVLRDVDHRSDLAAGGAS